MKRTYWFFSVVLFLLYVLPAQAAYHFTNYKGRPPIHVLGGASKIPVGLTPEQIKKAYNLPSSGGHGTVVIIGAYDDASLEADLKIFDTQFSLPQCTGVNGCLTEHPMSAGIKANSGWAMETSLDVEWAHAIAPSAKILLVEATTPSGANLLKAIDYAAAQKNIAAISMSWGGAEFPEESTLDPHFTSASGAPFFASSGDNGSGVSWPASSPKVIGVGGTSLTLNASGLSNETAWQGSGGGVSAYEKQPVYQSGYAIPRAGGMRAVPDVSYNADPQSGFSIVRGGKWYVVGGTSAGAPQWAALAALGSGVSLPRIYTDKAAPNAGDYFRDIISGQNGSCGYYCIARKHYDYITGLGSPVTVNF
jgi:subtilase family serine protease